MLLRRSAGKYLLLRSVNRDGPRRATGPRDPAPSCTPIIRSACGDIPLHRWVTGDPRRAVPVARPSRQPLLPQLLHERGLLRVPLAEAGDAQAEGGGLAGPGG